MFCISIGNIEKIFYKKNFNKRLRDLVNYNKRSDVLEWFRIWKYTLYHCSKIRKRKFEMLSTIESLLLQIFWNKKLRQRILHSHLEYKKAYHENLFSDVAHVYQTCWSMINETNEAKMIFFITKDKLLFQGLIN